MCLVGSRPALCPRPRPLHPAALTLVVWLAENMSGSWKEGGAPSSSCSSGYWSWSAPSDQSNPSTPSPPLSADCAKPFRSPAPDDGIDEAEAGSLLFDEPIPRKRKVSLSSRSFFEGSADTQGLIRAEPASVSSHPLPPGAAWTEVPSVDPGLEATKVHVRLGLVPNSLSSWDSTFSPVK